MVRTSNIGEKKPFLMAGKIERPPNGKAQQSATFLCNPKNSLTYPVGSPKDTSSFP